MRVLTTFNHAGGAAKTSTTRDIGYTLAHHHGLRVLLIDVDPQANLSSWLGVPDASVERTVARSVLQNEPLPEPYRVHGLDLIPSNLELALVEAQLPGQIGGIRRLHRHLRALGERYDFVLIDSPPSLGQLSGLAAIAADALVVPVPTTHKGVGGVGAVRAMVQTYRELNEQLHVAFYLPTLYNAQIRHHRESLDVMRELLSPLGTPVTFRPAIYPDAHAANVPIGVYMPGSPADLEVRAATSELLAALGEASVAS
ncbi:ParA family protein [Deinococcus pimensis]|uniref:ParA family protein n=1 Tax=Deinococcus pimensis TaxID=309888 RepID=UPI000489A917|nr:ParA family protein [Deinococcus pimensis]